MLRRIINSVVDTSFQSQVETVTYPSPFTKRDTINFGWLTSAAPCFPVSSKNISILTDPNQFYKNLLESCRDATKRITLVSLYLGNGSLEKTLVETLSSNNHFKNGDLKVNVLIDYTRGSRFQTNSRTMLKPLLVKNENNCNVSLYHTPVLRGLKKKLAPDRFNELFGLQHMKLYIFDDTLIISGANLSNDYFTNRQDRYFVIKDKNLCDFYVGLVSKVQQFCLKIDKFNNVGLNDGWELLPYEGRKNKFVHQAGDLIDHYLLEVKEEQNNHKQEGFDTWVFPLVQMGQLGIEQDSYVTDRILSEAPTGSLLKISTGYFNLTNQYMNTLVKESKAKCHILMAHPKANGFLGAKGVAGGIPFAYSLIASQFKENYEKLGQQNRFTLFEYLKDGWTFHGKGLWYYPPEGDRPCLTLIGSPNFGERSVNKDLETQLAIVTENKDLQNNFHEECCNLYKQGLPAETERIIPTWVHGFVLFFRNYF